MASHPPSRATSVAERRASAQAQARQKSRPTSSALSPVPDDRPESRKTVTRKASTTTTENRKETLTREAIISRTRSPLATATSSADGRRIKEVERPQKTEKPRAPAARQRSEEASGMSIVRTYVAMLEGVRPNNNKRAAPAVQPAPAWNPKATLLPPTSAPLASRISIPPLAAHAPAFLQPPPLNGLSLEAQETAVLEDLLFVFMGFEGQYIRYVDSYNPMDEKSRLSGPQFRILPGLDPSLRDLTSSMLKLATHYCAVEAFVEVQSKAECGKVTHALCAAMRKLIKDYLVLMAQLEHQMLTNSSFTLHQLNLHTKPTSHMMLQLYSVAHEILKENSMLDNEDDLDQSDDFENILESLKEGKDTAIPGKKVCKGGAVLRIVTRRLSSLSGDPAARQLLETLLREASRPYVAMLNEWLHHGNVRDPHGEFLIKEQKSIRREGLEQDYTDEYWEKRYTLRPEQTPPQLANVAERVLLAGKYLNVVRECGGIENPGRDLNLSAKVPHTFDDPRFLDNVSGAYAFANASLLTLLLTTHALPDRLKSLKHYFFLSRSDFLSHFLELTSSELRKPSKSVNTSKLQSLLDITLRQPGSVASEDPFKEDVSIALSDHNLTQWLMRVVNVQGMDAEASLANAYTPGAVGSTNSHGDEKEISGFEALTLDYAVPFPLSLVVSRVTLTRYQLLFRYLLSLRHLEAQLTTAWSEHTKSAVWIHRSKTPGVEKWKRRAWALRGRMLCFVQQLLYYCTEEVIEPNWRGFMGRLEQGQDEAGSKPVSRAGVERAGLGSGPGTGEAGLAGEEFADESKAKRTVDELMQDHVDFLATCLKECMLTNSKLLRINSKVTATCAMFASYTSSLTRYLAAADPSLPSSTSATATAPDPAKLEKLNSILQQYEDHFSRHLKILLDALNYLAATETVVFLGLCARLSMANEGCSGGGRGPEAYG